MLARIWNGALKAAPVRVWALLLSAPVITAGAAWLIMIVWQGGWAPERQEQQLDYLGIAMLGAVALLGIIVITFAAIKVRGSAGTASIDVSTGDSEPRDPSNG